MLSVFPRDVLDEIWNLIESVSKGFPTYPSNSISLLSCPSAYAKSLEIFVRCIHITPVDSPVFMGAVCEQQRLGQACASEEAGMSLCRLQLEQPTILLVRLNEFNNELIKPFQAS